MCKLFPPFKRQRFVHSSLFLGTLFGREHEVARGKGVIVFVMGGGRREEAKKSEVGVDGRSRGHRIKILISTHHRNLRHTSFAPSSLEGRHYDFPVLRQCGGETHWQLI